MSTVATARHLRRNMSLPEVLLWQRLRRRSLHLRFRRQHPIGPYVADFYCASRQLIIEIDGEAHDRGNRPEQDRVRDEYMTKRGLHIMRVAAARVLADPEAAAEAIVALAIPLHRSPSASGPPPHALHGEDLAGVA